MFWVSQECNQRGLCCGTQEIHNVLSVRRVTADEDPLLDEGLFEKFSDQDPEGFPLTYPAWHRNSTTKTATIKDWPNGALI